MNNPHVIFCDSYEALNKLYESGLPKHTKIITKSPAILNSKNPYVQNLEEYTNNLYQKEFRKKSKIFTYEIFNNLKKDKNYSEYSTLIAYKFLKIFLEKDYKDILKFWDSKSSYRSMVIKKYFGDVNKNAGKNGAELINKLIKSNTYGKILA